MFVPRGALCVLAATILITTACQQSGSTARLTAPTPSDAHVAPTGSGLVVGQVSPCYLPNPRTPLPPKHPAGTVVVLRGTVKWTPDGRGGQYLGPFPMDTVATESVPADGTYRFVLIPGPYVIVLLPWMSGSVPGGPTVSFAPYASVSVAAGQATHQNVPADCI